MFKTRWKPENAASELEKITKNQLLPGNVHQSVRVEQERDGGFTIAAGSVRGALYNTGVYIHVDPEKAGRGTIVTVEPDCNTNSQEAQQIEDKLREEYFKD